MLPTARLYEKMRNRNKVLRVVSLVIISLAGLIVFACFLASEQLLEDFANAERALKNRADTIASRLEDTFKETRERAEIIALNPLVQKQDSQIITGCLEKIWELSSSYEALLVIETDGPLIAGVPDGYDFHFLVENNSLDSLVNECEILCLGDRRRKDHYVFASATQVRGDNEEKGRLVITLVSLNHIARNTLLGDTEDQVSLWVGGHGEIILTHPDVSVQKDSVPAVISLLSRIVIGKPPACLKGTATVPKPECLVTVSKPYNMFLRNSVQETFSNYRFYALLFSPVFLLFLVIMLIINQSRHFFKVQAAKDGLTGLYNHRFFQTALRNLITRQKYPNVSLLMLDVDDFKYFNDTYGHQAGDQVLKNMADILLSGIRSTDIAARYGGEEFAVVLPGIGPEDALIVAERIRQTVKRRCKSTVSIGVSSYPEYAETAQELIQSADRALYLAKNLSKDCVEGIWNVKELCLR